ncbi:MAG: alpha/beta hydrolase [Oscillospiraceae bacterium]|nr:alpha/beta hydrolase [Oscillospiraceae bacterium]MDD4413054.1 alpha/beta hydrolase [Oscillospiraceae bacterium]
MNNRAYIIIHGFGGGLEEIGYLKEYLIKNDISPRCVLLAGHGGTKKELRKSKYMDWIRSGEQALEKAKNEYDSVVLMGFSMGGLICSYLETKYKVDGLVLINTPVYYWNIKVIAKSIIDDIKNRRCDNISYYKKAAFKTPIRSCIQFLRLLAKSKKIFQNIECPTLVIQCKNDETVKPKSAAFIERKIERDITVKYYEGGCHQVFSKTCECREKVCRDILNFCNNQKLKKRG